MARREKFDNCFSDFAKEQVVGDADLTLLDAQQLATRFSKSLGASNSLYLLVAPRGMQGSLDLLEAQLASWCMQGFRGRHDVQHVVQCYCVGFSKILDKHGTCASNELVMWQIQCMLGATLAIWNIWKHQQQNTRVALRAFLPEIQKILQLSDWNNTRWHDFVGFVFDSIRGRLDPVRQSG